MNFATGHAYFIGDASLRAFVNSYKSLLHRYTPMCCSLAFAVLCSAMKQSTIFTREVIKDVKIADVNTGDLSPSFHMPLLKFAPESGCEMKPQAINATYPHLLQQNPPTGAFVHFGLFLSR